MADEPRRSRSRSPLSREDKEPKKLSAPRKEENTSKTASKTGGIQIKLSSANRNGAPPSRIKAKAFQNDESDEEEMPSECRMRMRNIGRDTPTSSGPNSFGKTKQGFCDSKKMFEKNNK